MICDYQNFTTKDIARIFWRGLNELNIKSVFAIIGRIIGGAIA